MKTLQVEMNSNATDTYGEGGRNVALIFAAVL